MQQKRYIVIFLAAALASVYFFYSLRGKTLQSLPENSDIFVLIDLQKLREQALWNYVSHPTGWRKPVPSSIILQQVANAGLEIPRYLQVFHLPKTSFSEWHLLLSTQDEVKLRKMLKLWGFASREHQVFYNDQVHITLMEGKCLVSIGLAADRNGREILKSLTVKSLSASDHIDGTAGSITYRTPARVHRFRLDVQDDAITVNSAGGKADFNSLLKRLQTEEPFLSVEVDRSQKNHQVGVAGKLLGGPAAITRITAKANLEKVQDTVLSYSFDDDFNEVATKTLQESIRPRYRFDIESADPAAAWAFFTKKEWVDASGQFTLFPYENRITASATGFTILSQRNSQPTAAFKNQNHIFVKNSPNLKSFFSNSPPWRKKVVQHIDYVFYAAQQEHCFVQLKFNANLWTLVKDL